MTPALKAYIESWLDKAEHDLISAQRLLEIEPVILDNACFHCQQAVEKCLKAYLIYKGLDVEKTHNIIALLNQCANFDPVFGAIDPLDINAYAVQGRYPDNNLMPSKEEAGSYYQLALQIKLLVGERIIFY
ncbi:HEPN domain-containing protein [Mucilaginibacter sp.]|uniref:HEPN domain-containing protein n=1 Tax=Mucilaginibacter sp. TaxID=1882438 RepID=UPI002851C931|nr:HEPN domain-containing protein [Mucilaginibacter sp.]MDR3695761.1 HEPN domain-containing protein [Mucilaginibacter sp.]